MIRRLAALVMTVLLASSLSVVGVASPANAAVGSLAVSQVHPMFGERITVSGRLPVARGALVRLQYWGQGGWNNLASQRAASYGRFNFVTPAPTTERTYRVKRFAKITPRRTVYPRYQWGTATIPDGHTAGETVTLTATFSPVRRGRTVRLQRYNDACRCWNIDVATGVEDSYGKVRFTVVCNGSWAAKADPYNGATQFQAAPRSCNGMISP